MFISVILLQLGDGDHPWIPLVLPIFLFIISIALLFILLSSCSFLLLTHNSLTFNLSLPALKRCNSPGGKIPELWGSDIQEPISRLYLNPA